MPFKLTALNLYLSLKITQLQQIYENLFLKTTLDAKKLICLTLTHADDISVLN